ncbi:hypothetical protein [Nesterenkonia pannonica]|uniref:hypothetical protein n=1 Tax=Nesterenkonia pannonica TaxID=1548602 RepID=UPI00216416F8|nr:hypothetical protein [Nesterenkonia pannonica]
MRTEHIVDLAAEFDAAGYEHVDLMAPIQFDVAVRYLQEDPWERVRKAHELAPNTKFRALIRSKNIAAFDFLPDDVITAWVERLYANGFRVIGSFDGLNDVDNIAPGLRRAKELGAETFGAVSFSESPVHTDELFVSKAQELIEKADVDRIMLKDAGGLLTPERIRSLVPALKAVMGERPLEVHTHSLTGLAPLVCLEAAEAGADSLHLSVAPLAAGNGQPSVQNVTRDLRALGYRVNVDDAAVSRISDTLRSIAEAEGKPVGEPVEYNGMHFMHQTPGGMLSNFRSQLATAKPGGQVRGAADRNCPGAGRAGLSDHDHPFAQFVGTQAAMNVASGERYKMVPNEIKKYALGYYGKLLTDIDPEIHRKIVENGASDIPLEPSEPQPMLDAIAGRFPEESTDLHLLRAMFAGSQVDDMKAAVAEGRSGEQAPMPLLDLVETLNESAKPGVNRLAAGDLKITILKGENHA